MLFLQILLCCFVRKNLLKVTVEGRCAFFSTVFVCLLLIPVASAKAEEKVLTRYTGLDGINQTISWPIPDGISLNVPPELENEKMAQIGLVDVTAAPFFADPNGETDSTAAIQQAVLFARDRQMVSFFPEGIYLISDTIECVQNRYLRTTGANVGGRNFPCLLMGSRQGNRPKLVLRPASPGFGSAQHPKYVVYFWSRQKNNPLKPKPNSSMNQMFVGIDIEIGSNNPGAVAIRHRAAQGSAIQDCTIDVRYGLTGIEGGIGSGGSMTNITVIGGEIGLDMRETQPASTIVGITLKYQKKHAILYGGRQALSAVGLKILSSASGPVIKGLSAGGRPATGQICLVDSEIVFEKAGGIGISVAKSLYLNNVYIKGAIKAVESLDGAEVAGDLKDWVRIIEYAHGVRPKKWKGYQYTAPVYINGKKSDDDLVNIEKKVAPPAYLQKRHLWQNKFPSWESVGAANVRMPPYNAKGDAVTDDTSALQKAIDENEIVFLPKGYYKISRSLNLRAESKLIGVARHLSIIMAKGTAASFQNPERPKPLIVTKNVKNASTVLAFIGLWPSSDLAGVYALRWQSGGRSVLRSVNFITDPQQGYSRSKKSISFKKPLVVISGNGGGLWYNFYQDGVGGGDDYRHLLVEKTMEPLRFYQLNLEHGLGDANIEIRQASNISIFGLKGEGNKAVLKVIGARNVKVFGYGGNAAALPGEALFLVDNSSDFLFANMVDTPRIWNKAKEWKGFGEGVDPRLWRMIKEKKSGGGLFMSDPLERPVLYKRGAD